MKNNKEGKKNENNYLIYICIVCIYLFIFQQLLQTKIDFFRYFDEIIAVVSIPILLSIIIHNKGNVNIKKYDLHMIILVIILFATGLYSSLKFKYQSINIALSDAFLVLKFFLAYMLSQLLIKKEFIDKNNSKIYKHAKIITYLFLALTIANYTFNIWPNSSYRMGIMSNQLFYSHPTMLASSCVFLIALIMLTKPTKKIPIINIVILFFILLSTLRFKAVGAAIIVLAMLFYLHYTKKKITLLQIGIVAIIAILLSWKQINYYFINVDAGARSVLFETSIKIAEDYFPVGTGFATFGSYFSSVSYSPVYMMYGINNIWGLEKGRTFFVSDNFWPMIIGQFGVIGLICYLLLLFITYKKIQNEYSERNKYLYITKLISLGYLIISSTSESAFVSPFAIPFALIIGISIKKDSKIIITNKNIKDEE